MQRKNDVLLRVLACPHCHLRLAHKDEAFQCHRCGEAFPCNNGVPHFLRANCAEQYERETHAPINRLKMALKRRPMLFQFLHYTIGSVSYFGVSARQAISRAFQNAEDKIIVSVGSGVKRIHPRVINLDIFPLKEVDVVADAAALPFPDASVDMIISESVLEHVPDAETAVKEMIRVVKPGGYLYISIPFLMGFHASPNDYIRLTHAGLAQKFKDFKPIQMGMIGGPASALVTFLMYFLALPFSIISEAAYNYATYFFLVILSPLRFLDAFFNVFPKAIEIAAVVYLYGRKE